MFAWKTLAIAAVILLAAGAAPAQYAAEVGKKVEIHVANPPRDMPDPEEIPPVLREAGTKIRVEAQARKSGEAVDLTFKLWGDGIATDIEARLRSAFPALKDAQITVSSIEGQVQTNVAGLVERKLFRDAGDDPVKLEAARRQVQEQLRKEHPNAEVDVQVTPDGKRTIRVIERKKKE